MAGVFDTTSVGGPQESPITVKAGITPAPSDIETLAPFLKMGAEELMRPQESNTSLNQFSREQLNTADAVAQGSISPSEGQARMRANVSKFIANNPGVEAKDVFDIQSKIVGTAGLGRIVTTGNKEYQEKEEALKTARDERFVLPGMAPEEVEMGLKLSIQNQILKRNMQQQMELTSFRSSQVGLEKSTLDLQSSKDQRASRAFIDSFAEVKRGQTDLEIGVISRRAKLPNTDPNYLTGEQAVQELNKVKFNLQEQLRSLGPAAGGEYLSGAARPTLDYVDSVIKVVSGELPRNVADNQYNASLKQMQLGMITTDPKLKTLVALDNLFKNTPINLIKTVTDKTVEYYTRGSNGDATEGVVQDLANPNNKADVVPYLKGIESHNQSYVAGKYDAAAKQQVDNNNESIIKSVANAKNSSAEDLVPLVNYLASPSFGQYVRNRGGVPAGAGEANLVLERQYKEQVLPLIQEKLREKEVILGKFQPRGASVKTGIEQYIDVGFRGDGVSFSVAPSQLDATTLDRVRTEVDDLNKTVAPQLTKLSRLSSNFNMTNPKAEWDSLKEQVFLKERIKEEPEATRVPQLHPEDVAWVKAATTLDEKKRRAQILGVPVDMIEQATRGK